MAYTNLTGVFENLLDGNLTVLDSIPNKTVLILGSASQGLTETVYLVSDDSIASSYFGNQGTLIRTMQEVRASAGSDVNILLYRIGAQASYIDHVGTAGGTGGVKIQPVTKDASALDMYKMTWDDSEAPSGAGRLRVWDTNDTLVFDNNPNALPGGTGLAYDKGEVYVTGLPQGGLGKDIIKSGATNFNDPSNAVLLSGVHAIDSNVAALIGVDGTTLHRRKLYEALYEAYAALDSINVDMVIPADVYMDDRNVVKNDGHILTGVDTIPSDKVNFYLDSTRDALGKLYVQEYEGEFYYWWDLDGDGAAEVYPGMAGTHPESIQPNVTAVATASKDLSGNTLTTASFHEVNFAHQLAWYLYVLSSNEKNARGVIGMRPWASRSRGDIARWIGVAPAKDSYGNLAVDGSGLLGNKFVAGTTTHIPGFFATASGWLDDSSILKDKNNKNVDIGRYISIVPDWVQISGLKWATDANMGRPYLTSFAPSCGALETILDSKESITNLAPGKHISLAVNVARRKLDVLSGSTAPSGRIPYVMLKSHLTRRLVINNGDTAALNTSDWTRITTMHIIYDLVGDIRAIGDKYEGKAAMSGPLFQAMQSAIKEAVQKRKGAGYLTYGEAVITATAAQQVTGDVYVSLTLTPVFETRRIHIVVGLRLPKVSA